MVCVNGRPAAEFTLDGLRNLLRRPDTLCHLELDRDGQRYLVTLRLHRLV